MGRWRDLLQKRILIAEDEPAVALLLEHTLQKAGYQTLVASDGDTALQVAQAQRPDLVLLDVMLPGMDGFALCRELQRTADIPVMFLTARSEEVDKVVGLELGADDYLTKPFSPSELVARVRAVLRRAARPAPGPAPDAGAPLQCGDLTVDPARCEVWRRNREIALTPLEFKLLVVLVQNAGLVLSREQLLDKVWGPDYYGDPRVVDVHMRHLRQKLEEDPANPRFVVTVRGMGYKFQARPREGPVQGQGGRRWAGTGAGAGAGRGEGG